MDTLKNKNTFFKILLLIAIFTLLVRFLGAIHFERTALLYVGIPFLIAIALLYLTNYSTQNNWRTAYKNNLRNAFIIMFASSILLHEGFVCVLMFMPIYLFIVLLVFTLDFMIRLLRPRSKYLKMHWFSIFFIIASLEGVHPITSFNRENTVSATQIVNASIEQLKENLLKPINLDQDQPWFLKIFPMPVAVEAGTLYPGAVHTIHYEYNRWLITNTHKGHMLLQISDVGTDYVETKILENTSYIATYIDLKGTRIEFRAIDATHSEVKLSIAYTRQLDPNWYFGPLESYALTQTANYLITKVIAR